MADTLSLIVRSGALIEQAIPVPPEGFSVGGRGSSADMDISGVAHGLELAEFRLHRRKWVLEETAVGQVRINGRRPSRRNVLRTGDEISLPGVNADVPILLEVQLERERLQPIRIPGLNLSKLNPQFVALGLFYVFGLIALGVALSNRDQDNGPAVVADVETTLTADIEAAAGQAPGGVLYSREIRTFGELLVLLESDADDAEKERYTEGFIEFVVLRFDEARRLSDRGLVDEAIDAYEAIVDLLGDAKLGTTAIALRELGTLDFPSGDL